MGYSVRHLRLADRVVYGVTGLFLLLPVGAFPAARWFNIAGAALVVVLLMWERTMRRTRSIATVPTPETATATPVSTPATPTPVQQQELRERFGIRGSGDAE
jgi:hypothetical protein